MIRRSNGAVNRRDCSPRTIGAMVARGFGRVNHSGPPGTGTFFGPFDHRARWTRQPRKMCLSPCRRGQSHFRGGKGDFGRPRHLRHEGTGRRLVRDGPREQLLEKIRTLVSDRSGAAYYVLSGGHEVVATQRAASTLVKIVGYEATRDGQPCEALCRADCSPPYEQTVD